MKTKYQSLFPSILSIEAVVEKMEVEGPLRKTFSAWSAEEQMQFFEICTGICGPGKVWDSMLSHVFSKGLNQGLLNNLLESLLGIQIEKSELAALQSGVRTNDRKCLLTAFIWFSHENYGIREKKCTQMGYVELYKSYEASSPNGIITSDIESEYKKYTIVLFEKCPEMFTSYEECYIHHACQQFDSGVRIEDGQELCFVMLDVFEKCLRKMGIRDAREAWLAFLSINDPEILWNLLVEYPMLWSLYDTFYDMVDQKMNVIMKCLNDIFNEKNSYGMEERKNMWKSYRQEV